MPDARQVHHADEAGDHFADVRRGQQPRELLAALHDRVADAAGAPVDLAERRFIAVERLEPPS